MASVAKDFLDIIKDIRGTNFTEEGLPKEGFWFDVKTWHTEVEADRAEVAANTSTVAADKATVTSLNADTLAIKNAAVSELSAIKTAAEDSLNDIADAAVIDITDLKEDAEAAKDIAIANKGYALEWANSSNPVSVAAGGNGETTLSAKTLANQAIAAKDAALVSQNAASTSATNAATSATNSATSATNSDNSATLSNTRAGYAAEWANNAPDTIVSTAAGGGTGVFSARHHASKAAISATSAATSATTATSAASSLSAAVSTCTTQASIATNAANSAGASATTATTQANSAILSRNVAWEWANKAENSLVNDGVNPASYSAYHWAMVAEAQVDTLINGITEFTDLTDTPSSYTGHNNKVLRVNEGTSSIAFHTLVKADVGLASVDNTSDMDKPVSTATSTALSAKADTSALSATDGRVTTLENKTADLTYELAVGSDPARYQFGEMVYSTVVQELNTLQNQALATYDAVKKALAAETIGAY